MRANDLEKLERVFRAALEMEPGARPAFVAEQLPGEPDLITEVESLLAAAQRDGDFLETSLVDAPFHAPDVLGLTAGRMIGPYRLIRELGRGGMGVVYEAEQIRPQRRVALKIVHGGFGADGAGLRHMGHESRILGRLNHPCVAAIYDASQTPDGLSYFVMELIEGERLDEYVVKQRVARRERLKLFCKICEAIQHAHMKSVVHLDLKPSNILVAPAKNPRYEDVRVKVVDFGIAATVGGDTTLPTRVGATGGLPGTLAYMSPEQRLGLRDAIDVRSDVYSLGVILFKLMTGELPYPIEGQPYAEAWRILTMGPPRRARQLDHTIPADVDTIIRTATAEEPARRYQSVAELAADVHDYLSDLPIAARPPSKSYEWAKFAKRNKGLVGILAAVVLGLAGTIVGTSIGLVRARSAEAREQFLTDLLVQEFSLRADSELARTGGREAQHTPAIERRSALEDKRNAAKRSLTEGQLAEAEADYARLVRISQAIFPGANWYVATLQAEHAECLIRLQRYDDAERQLLASYEGFKAALGEEHRETLDTGKRLAKLYNSWGRLDRVSFWSSVAAKPVSAPDTQPGEVRE